jgi:hypothetical protein
LSDVKRARRRLQRIVDDWKGQGCIDCGWTDIRAIDPDHRDEALKVDNLSRLVTLCASVERIKAELAKCDPRCARCHRLRTAERRPSSWRSRDRLPPSWTLRIWLQDLNDLIKIGHGCADCGWNAGARALDWDHVRGHKSGGIATMIANRRTLREIYAEMSKCEVVCANCHRIRTVNRLMTAASTRRREP